MQNALPSFFTPLVEPVSNVTPSGPPAPFDSLKAYLLGQCCNLSYVQFDAGVGWQPDFSSLALPGFQITASACEQFIVYEANEPGAITSNPGDYYQTTGGFAVQLTLTPKQGAQETVIVIALRGTRTWEEWFKNADAFPVIFPHVAAPIDGLGSVHAGFLGDYTLGTNGMTVSSPLNPDWTQRAPNSLASWVGKYVSGLSGNYPIYVTGHSLGGALAAFCALDIASNFAGKFSELYMYSLAAPRVAVGISDIPTLDNQQAFVWNYQNAVPNTYQIVHAADIIPILPPTSISLGPLKVTCAHVSDPCQVGGGATATAVIANGGVSSVTVNNQSSAGYTSAAPPTVVFTGGGGSGAAATASISLFGDVDVNVTNPGSGYTSAPTVQIISSGSLTENVVSFCAQTGDIGGNHACLTLYVPYLEQLANNFS